MQVLKWISVANTVTSLYSYNGLVDPVKLLGYSCNTGKVNRCAPCNSCTVTALTGKHLQLFTHLDLYKINLFLFYLVKRFLLSAIIKKLVYLLCGWADDSRRRNETYTIITICTCSDSHCAV